MGIRKNNITTEFELQRWERKKANAMLTVVLKQSDVSIYDEPKACVETKVNSNMNVVANGWNCLMRLR